jgi:isopentenyl-diphosphate Delta-isomerase
MIEYVVLVNDQDQSLGNMEKIEAHKMGLLHRAFSIIIFNNKGEMLLQKRAKSKYHSGGLWTNACCSHPRPNETIEEAGKRRMQEELQFSCSLTHSFSFIYKVHLDNSFIEYELDHVLFGTVDCREILPNPEEASEVTWITLEKLFDTVKNEPNSFTYWFQIILNQHKETIYQESKRSQMEVIGS